MKQRASTSVRLALAAAVLLISAGQVLARPDTRSYTCAQNKALVAQHGAIVMSTGPNTWARIVSGGQYCLMGEILEWKYVPARDTPRCLAGYICNDNYYID